MRSSGMPWPGDGGEQRWNLAWRAIKKVLVFENSCHVLADQESIVCFALIHEAFHFLFFIQSTFNRTIGVNNYFKPLVQHFLLGILRR
jgi:hypothetical protein